MRKRLLASLLFLRLFVGLFPTMAVAEESTSDAGKWWDGLVPANPRPAGLSLVRDNRTENLLSNR